MGDEAIRGAIRQAIRDRGATAAARELGMQRETLLALAAGARVQKGTLAYAEKQVLLRQGARAS